MRIKEADQELQRQAGLLKNKIAAQADYDRAEAAVLAFKARLEQQQAEVTVAEKQVAYWKQQMEDTIIRAPFAGIVTSKNAQPGEMISPMSAGGGFTRTGICTIVDMESLEIEIDVNESYINRVHARAAGGSDARRLSGLEDPVQGDRDHPHGRPPEVDGESARRFRAARSAHPAGDGREGGVSGSGRVRTRARGRTVIVPTTAVRAARTGAMWCFVVQSGRAERRAVTVSRHARR